VEQLAIVVSLKAGTQEQARKLIADGPPFDLREKGFSRHTVYLSANEVVFAFEGEEVSWLADVQEVFKRWRPLVEGTPRIARAAFVWAHEPERTPPAPRH
jgi:hypothetical protein